MVNFLVPLHLLVNSVLDRTHVPDDTRHWRSLDRHLGSCNSRWLRLKLFWVWKLSEPIVFERMPDDFDITVSHVEVVSSIWRQVWSDLDRILVNSENQVLLSYFIVYFNYWTIFKQHARKLDYLTLLSRLISL